jgi:hypothetical protein
MAYSMTLGHEVEAGFGSRRDALVVVAAVALGHHVRAQGLRGIEAGGPWGSMPAVSAACRRSTMPRMLFEAGGERVPSFVGIKGKAGEVGDLFHVAFVVSAMRGSWKLFRKKQG